MIQQNHEEFEGFIKHYWQYYKELESEILNTRRYVDFDEGNFPSFSVEYLKLYQAICSEIDVLGKVIAQSIDKKFKPDDKQNNIYKWWLIIQDKIQYPFWDDYNLKWDFCELEKAEINFFNYIPIKPWRNFETEVRPDKNGVMRTEVVRGKGVPVWWSDYNKVKHQRTSSSKNAANKINYTKANPGNVAYSISALYVLEKSYMHAIGTKNDIEAFCNNSALFTKIEYSTTNDIQRILSNVTSDENKVPELV